MKETKQSLAMPPVSDSKKVTSWCVACASKEKGKKPIKAVFKLSKWNYSTSKLRSAGDDPDLIGNGLDHSNEAPVDVFVHLVCQIFFSFIWSSLILVDTLNHGVQHTSHALVVRQSLIFRLITAHKDLHLFIKGPITGKTSFCKKTD